ncbi:MAG: glutamyl-tRNA reductase [Ottowia sp.]|nr:glutamyl-tRNA reductase [Ottowia sp.]
MTVWALGLNHNTAPVDLRGRFAFALDQITPALAGLREGHPQHPEAAILSTCNRTEVYCASDTVQVDHTLGWLAQAGNVPADALRQHSYVMQDDQAARHAFRVASGLDSMVLGEAQILGQLKRAIQVAQDAGALGTTLNQLFQRSFSVAKQVRSSTEIGAHSISMAAAAVELASQLFEDLGQLRVLFIGAGEMIALAATHFAARNPKSMTIANRTLARSEHLASGLGAEAMRLADLPAHLHEFDAIISSTASALPIIGLGAIRSAVKKRRHRPIFMVDLAVPRDIEPEVAQLNDVYLYTVDDLAGIVKKGHASREAAVSQAEAIVDAGVQSFMHWLEQRDSSHGVVPLIQELNAQADQWQAIELARARRRLARGEDVDAVLQALARGMSQKMLHGARVELNTAAPGARQDTMQNVARMFLRDEIRR